MRSLAATLTIVTLAVCVPADHVVSAQSGRFGVRAGIGTDVSGGIAYGLGGNYVLPVGAQHLELGLSFFGGSFKETTDEGAHAYEEQTDVLVIGMMANYLYGYVPTEKKAFFIAGMGLGSINVE